MIGVSFQAGPRNFLFYNVQTGFGVHPASYPINTEEGVFS
jgi:hypothetical protein